jgi:3-methylcrotonyl-CoA carboxylase alpha subunit
VTEEITGQDLVEWQLRVASGEKLPKRQEELSINGHAVEARLYAEDATKDFLPSIGDVTFFDVERRDVRLDTSVGPGDKVSPFYDPMVAKLIAHAADREIAIENLAGACADAWIWPVKTNAPFLWRALDHPDFRAGKLDTGFIARHWDALLPAKQPTGDMLKQGAVGLVLAAAFPEQAYIWDHAFERELKTASLDVWRHQIGFRLNAEPARTISFAADGERHVVELPKHWQEGSINAHKHSDGLVVFDEGVAVYFSPSAAGQVSGSSAGDGAITSPMPGRVIAVEVRQGDSVSAGQKLLTLEAMKMEHSLAAPFDGIVAELHASEGGQVTEGTMLVRIEPAD